MDRGLRRDALPGGGTAGLHPSRGLRQAPPGTCRRRPRALDPRRSAAAGRGARWRARRCRRHAGERPQADVALHVSGVASAAALEPLRSAGSAIGGFHPLRAFPAPERCVEEAAGVFFALDGDPAAIALGQRLAAAFGGTCRVDLGGAAPALPPRRDLDGRSRDDRRGGGDGDRRTLRPAGRGAPGLRQARDRRAGEGAGARRTRRRESPARRRAAIRAPFSSSSPTSTAWRRKRCRSSSPWHARACVSAPGCAAPGSAPGALAELLSRAGSP